LNLNILDTIVARKRIEIVDAKNARSESALRDAISGLSPTRGFSSALSKSGLRIIAEVKKASPSAGVIRADFDPVAIAKIYQANGADCASVLTDRDFFQGDLAYLTQIHRATALPTLRKEFILDPYQILEARAAGADAILLIAEILPGSSMEDLHDFAVSLSLDVLIELHDADQLQRVVDTGTKLIGINNRDLRTFQTRLEHTIDLMADIPKDRMVVGESGIKTHADMQRLEAAGVKAVLVGESLMRAPDIGRALRELRGV
jgi:indole-3-glycerol phosphate synthase